MVIRRRFPNGSETTIEVSHFGHGSVVSHDDLRVLFSLVLMLLLANSVVGGNDLPERKMRIEISKGNV